MRFLPIPFLFWLVCWTEAVPVTTASSAELQVEIQDETTRKTVPARLYLEDDKGTHWCPEGVVKYDKGREHHFISSGSFAINLPFGRYQLTAERGPEYRSWTSAV